ncbi:Crp/Fnr family transcriptional regulator [Neolewinella aurantiaca]|uniref:Crp/Fnr family transcriptional regulator n=1 Tax=Neolewinella aurantiaca TaxID=2602767 RepID=A0A5C7FZY9_9BACT|nr:Crp/Fnr family transcriptional regulator [Neolewinella aurantiaca]TXF90916.1 Crp/Fnr family transcriptional regulator [Neolewinella aurantiaca]
MTKINTRMLSPRFFPQTPELKAKPRKFVKGEYLYQPADRLESVFIISSGMVKIGGYGPEGEEAIYDIAGPEEFCGNLKYLGGGRFHEFARAVTDVETITYDLRAFKRAFRKDESLHDWFVRLMVMRWARSESRLFRIASLKPRKRLAALLEELGATANNVTQLVTQADLANLTGLSRQTISKLLVKMEQG